MYQAFGTKESTDVAYTFNFTAGERADADFNDLTFSLYFGTGGSDGSAPSTVSTLTLASSQVYDFRSLPTESGVAITASQSVTLSALAVPVGETVYLAIGSIDDQVEAGSQQALIDDISAVAVVPEPTSAVALVAGGLILLGRRRRA